MRAPCSLGRATMREMHARGGVDTVTDHETRRIRAQVEELRAQVLSVGAALRGLATIDVELDDDGRVVQSRRPMHAPQCATVVAHG